MALTTAQLTELKAAILAETDPTFVGYRDNGQTTLMRDWYNADSSPAFVVWRKMLSKEALRIAALAGASEMDNLEAGKRDALFWMLSESVDPSLSATRQAFLDLTANRSGGFVATALRTSLTAAAKRTASRVEKLFTPGTGTTGSPGDLVVVGPISDFDISAALAA